MPVPIFLLSKVPVAETTKLSPLTKPEYEAEVTFVVALVFPSYVLLDAVIPETVKAFAVMFAVVV